MSPSKSCSQLTTSMIYCSMPTFAYYCGLELFEYTRDLVKRRAKQPVRGAGLLCSLVKIVHFGGECSPVFVAFLLDMSNWGEIGRAADSHFSVIKDRIKAHDHTSMFDTFRDKTSLKRMLDHHHRKMYLFEDVYETESLCTCRAPCVRGFDFRKWPGMMQKETPPWLPLTSSSSMRVLSRLSSSCWTLMRACQSSCVLNWWECQ